MLFIRSSNLLVAANQEEAERLSDGRAFDIIHRLREDGVRARIIAECVDDQNRERLKKAGADAVVRPLRGYPEMIVRTIVAPGTERIIERLFGSEGDGCLRFAVRVEGITWSRLISAILEANFGTLIGYMDTEGHLHTNPALHKALLATAPFVLVDDAQRPTAAAIQEALDQLASHSQL